MTAASTNTDHPAGEHSGARLGLPATGPGSMATLGRRVVALLIDWLACLAICIGIFRMDYPPTGLVSLLPLAVLFVENVLLVGTLGTTLGHRVMGMAVQRLTGGPLGIVGAALRSLLLVLVIPAVIWDADGRGFHDRIAGSVLVRTR